MPVAKRDDALAADAALLARIETVTAGERDRFSFAMGPVAFAFDAFIGLARQRTRHAHLGIGSPSTMPR